MYGLLELVLVFVFAFAVCNLYPTEWNTESERVGVKLRTNAAEEFLCVCVCGMGCHGRRGPTDAMAPLIIIAHSNPHPTTTTTTTTKHSVAA